MKDRCCETCKNRDRPMHVPGANPPVVSCRNLGWCPGFDPEGQEEEE